MSRIRTDRKVLALALALLGGFSALALGAGPSPPVSGTATRTGPGVAALRVRVLPVPDDDRTFRPTVVVRRGLAQGSGTIIASVDGETLILTAAHVLAETNGKGPPEVELHRYNVGLEQTVQAGGGWPNTAAAAVIATDPAADLAVLRVAQWKRLPYVARLAPAAFEPAPGTIVTSVGIDLGAHLSSWPAAILQVDRLTLENQTEERPFLITTRPPEHGRSGGGLFLPGGALVGVCIGRVEEPRRRRVGVFAAAANIRRLLRDHDLEAAILRSETLARQSLAARRPGGR